MADKSLAGKPASPPTAPTTEPADIQLPVIEVDNPALNDADSTVGDDDARSAMTASLTSSVLNYPYEHGRRYHAFRRNVQAYPMPNDEREIDRLDLMHTMMIEGTGDSEGGFLYHAPIDQNKVHRILDCGTGTGAWAIAMGDLFPAAEVLGNDLSAIQSTWVPPNVKFEVDDLESDWTHPRASFDFIFCRYMAGSIRDWPKLARNIYEHVSPGGWAEFQDFDFHYYSEDGSLKDDSYIMKYISLLFEAGLKNGADVNPGATLEQWVRDAGFQDVCHKKFRFPIGSWPRDSHLKMIGHYNMTQLLDGLEGFSLHLFCNTLGWREEEVTVLLAKVRSELADPNIHPMYNFHVVYGRKP